MQLKAQEELAKLQGRVQQTVRNVLADVQGYSAANSLANSDPNKWMLIAANLVQGAKITKLSKTLDVDPKTIRRVNIQLMESPEAGNLKRELGVRALDVVQDSIRLNNLAGEKILESYEDLEWNEIDPKEASEIKKNISYAMRMDVDTFMRVRGDNVQRIEVTDKRMSKEDYFDVLKQAREIARKEAIDIESEE